jgi:hypothetical protein
MSLRDQMRHELKELAKLAATMPATPSAPPPSVGATAPASAPRGEFPRELSASHRTIPPMVASLSSPSLVAAAEAQEAKAGGTWHRRVQATLAIAGLAAVVVGGIAVGRLLTSSAASPALPVQGAAAAPGPVTDLDEPLAPATASPVTAKGVATEPAAAAPNPGAATHHTLPSPNPPLPKAIVSRPTTSPAPSTTSAAAATPAASSAGGQVPSDLLQQIRAAVQSRTKN